eukprot:g3950.t1
MDSNGVEAGLELPQYTARTLQDFKLEKDVEIQSGYKGKFLLWSVVYGIGLNGAALFYGTNGAFAGKDCKYKLQTYLIVSSILSFPQIIITVAFFRKDPLDLGSYKWLQSIYRVCLLLEIIWYTVGAVWWSETSGTGSGCNVTVHEFVGAYILSQLIVGTLLHYVHRVTQGQILKDYMAIHEHAEARKREQMEREREEYNSDEDGEYENSEEATSDGAGAVQIDFSNVVESSRELTALVSQASEDHDVALHKKLEHCQREDVFFLQAAELEESKEIAGEDQDNEDEGVGLLPRPSVENEMEQLATEKAAIIAEEDEKRKALMKLHKTVIHAKMVAHAAHKLMLSRKNQHTDHHDEITQKLSELLAAKAALGDDQVEEKKRLEKEHASLSEDSEKFEAEKEQIHAKESETKETLVLLHSQASALAAKCALAKHIHELNEEF